jgi:hypothetical protein
MQFVHHQFTFDVPHEWWIESGIANFRPPSQAYRVKAQPDRDVYTVRIDDVAPVERRLREGVFRKHPMKPLSAKDRVLEILRGFAANDEIPPVQVVRLSASERYRYKLTDGAHRFYLSIAAGFTHVPAVDGFDYESLTVRS